MKPFSYYKKNIDSILEHSYNNKKLFKEKAQTFKETGFCIQQKDLMPIERLWKYTRQQELINE